TRIPVSARVFLGEIPLEDVAVEVYFGVLDSRGAIVGGELVTLTPDDPDGDGIHGFRSEIECRFCGRQGFLLRVMPRHRELGPIYEPGLLLWG
ncbi:MAG TPA: alpha-glucan phosphorylase, partial [Geobacteraceae bacterium]